MKIGLSALLLCCASIGVVQGALASPPLAVDSRIRTVIYNENEVFKLVTDYGYQSNIVFSEKERVRTISIGDAVPFKITPSENRIFIKALQRSHVTNMTVVTTERVYQFELSSNVKSARDVVYVMRFFYPQEDIESLYAGEIKEQSDVSIEEFSPQISQVNNLQNSTVVPDPSSLAESAEQEKEEKIDFSSYVNESLAEDEYNYIYSISGPSGDYDFSPLKIFDDGETTFLKFNASDIDVVSLFAVEADGGERPLNYSFDGEYIVINEVLGKVSVRLGNDVLCVYNDKISG